MGSISRTVTLAPPVRDIRWSHRAKQKATWWALDGIINVPRMLLTLAACMQD